MPKRSGRQDRYVFESIVEKVIVGGLDENGNVTESETGTKVTYTNEDFAAKVKVVVNKSGKLLPGTGGTGEMLFTVSGVLIAIVAGVVLLNTKRRKRIV